MLVMGLAPSVWIPTIENRIGTPAVKGSNILPESGLSIPIDEEGRP
jgi:hypothetical protein